MIIITLTTVKDMIDIHTHVLAYIDDGAKDLVESRQMIECLKNQDVNTAICTPHFDPRKNSMEDFVEKREKAIYAINDSSITLISASETLYDDLLYQYYDLDYICVNNTKYLLLELSYQGFKIDYYLESFHKLMNLFNIIPIIAHIERYNILWKNKNNIKKLKNLGCLMQLNAQTIIDKKRRKTGLDFIKKGFVDLIGSDCHNMSQRPPNLKEAFLIIEKEIGTSYSDLLQNNADLIIKGSEL